MPLPMTLGTPCCWPVRVGLRALGVILTVLLVLEDLNRAGEVR